MSCGCGLEWSSRRPWRAGPRLLREILRFLRGPAGRRPRTWTASRSTASCGDEGYSESFRWHFLVPTDRRALVDRTGRRPRVPAAYAVELLRNHGMLGLRRLRWRTVTGGSRVYVRALLDRLGAQVQLGGTVRPRCAAPLPASSCGPEAVRCGRFDGVVVATSAPTGRSRLLEDPSDDERGSCSALRDDRERDRPAHRRAPAAAPRLGPAASWNYQSPGCGVHADRPTITYYLNRLQRLDDADGLLRHAQPHGRDRPGHA